MLQNQCSAYTWSLDEYVVNEKRMAPYKPILNSNDRNFYSQPVR